MATLQSQYAHALESFEDETRSRRPVGAEVLDAHTHLGLDEDGRSLDLAGLLDMLDAAEARRACVFPLHDPERRPAYRVPNDRVLAWAAESDGRLIPFCRLDPGDDPLREGERCLSAGAGGIKLHPRAQGFMFGGTTMEAIGGIFGLADQARVPILIHAGRGMPPMAEGLAEVALEHPDVVLILAHAAIADQAMLTSRLADHPGVLYDTSCFYPLDVIELLARVPAERVVFGSDPPYGRPLTALYMALRVAGAVGLGNTETKLLLGGTMSALVDGRGLPPATPPRASGRISILGPLARLYSYCAGTGPALFMGQLEAARISLDLALAVCRDPHPGAAGPALERIGRALEAVLAIITDASTVEEVVPAIDLLHRCMSLAATEG